VWARKGGINSVKKTPRKETSIELKLQESLTKQNIDFDKQIVVPNICVIDIVPKNTKIAVFCDGNYWHGDSRIYSIDKLNSVQKRNSEHDIIVNEKLKQLGWKVLRFYGSEIRSDSNNCALQIIGEIK